jgi:hypothetical protein
MNIHDEIMCVTHPDAVDEVAEVVSVAVEEYRPQVPLIGMKWAKKMNNWAEKGAGSEIVHIKPPETENGEQSRLLEALDEGPTGCLGIAESDCPVEQAAQEEADLRTIESEWRL